MYVTSLMMSLKSLIHGRVDGEMLGLGLIQWVDDGAIQSHVLSVTKVFLPKPCIPATQGFEGPWEDPAVTVMPVPCHVSDACPTSGMTKTVMSSPEPSFSLGSRQPRSFSTPRDLISKSWAASVYLLDT